MNQDILMGVLGAISDVEGIDLTDLNPPLEECVSADALQQLARHDSSSWSLSFEFSDHSVTVAGDGWVSVNDERVSRWSSIKGGET